MNVVLQKKQTLITTLFILYVPIVSYLITNAVRQDQLYDMQSNMATIGMTVAATRDGTFNLNIFFWFLIIYAVRIAILLWMSYVVRPEKRSQVIKSTLLVCLIPEALIISHLFPKYEGPQNGLMSPYGDLRTYFIFFLACSVLLQIITMIINAILLWRHKNS